MMTTTKRLLTVATLGLTMAGSATAQLNPDHGLDFYAATINDMNHERSWIHFTSANPHHLDRLNHFFDDDDFMINAFRCGAWTPNGYVGYMSKIFSFVEKPLAFTAVNVKTGDFSILFDMSDDAEFGQGWPVIFDLDYDWSSGTLYGMGQGRDWVGNGISTIYSVNPQTGVYTLVNDELTFVALAMAIDYDGYFYFIGMEGDDEGMVNGASLYKMQMGSNHHFTTLWKKPLTVNGEAFPVYYANDMTFDYTTGDLYWAADDINTNWQRLVRINPETAETTRLGSIGQYESVVGMYIPFTTADTRTAPAAVSNVGVTYANAGTAVTLEWTNPTTQWNRAALTDLDQVLIARDSKTNIVATLDASGLAGQTMTWTDTEASQGVHTYYFMAKNAGGKGIVKEFRAQAGADTPGEVFGLSATVVTDEDVVISWAKPEMGEHEGWYDDATLTYDVVRQPDGAVVAKGTTETTVHDTNLGAYDSYYYEVTAINAAGRGVKAVSRNVLAGYTLKAPYTATFTSQQLADRWTVIDANGDGKTWEWIGQNGVDEYQRMNLNSESVDDDLLVSPKLYVEEGKTYRLSADVFMDWRNQYVFQFRQGETKNLEDLELVDIFHYDINEGDPEYVHETFEAIFEANHTGDEYIAFRSLSEAAISNIGVFAIRFEEVPQYDLTLQHIEMLPDAVQGKPATATMLVANRGLETVKASEYKVEAYCIDNGEVWGEAQGRYSVRPDEAEEITVEFVPSAAGNLQVAFRVVCEKDGNADNDATAPRLISVSSASADAWNVEITANDFRGEGIDRDTRVPFDFMSIYSIEQSIYDASTIEVEGDITRIGYRYTMNDYVNAMPMVGLSLGTTKLAGYASVRDAIPASELTNVYYGPMEFNTESGDHVMVFDLETPFPISKGENLIVQVEKEGDCGSMWPIVTHVFNKNSSSAKGNFGTIRAASDKSMPALAAGQPIEAIPAILLAISTQSGLKTIVLEPAGNGTFDLLGRPATEAEHGLFIQNGKKVVK